jgi:hypothetical protein
MDSSNIGFVGGFGIELAMMMQAAKAGDGQAACRLGDLYRDGEKVSYNPKKALRWYARSALLGDPVGQNQLGACYEHGVGCRPNPRRAAKYYALSASQGCSTAQKNLGLCYLVGRGVSRDLEQARSWLQGAADQGEPGAAEKLAELPPSPTSRAAACIAAPQGGGRWAETVWLKERTGDWDCIGDTIMSADAAEQRSKALTELYGRPSVQIFTATETDRVGLTWEPPRTGAKFQLTQYGCEREHV